MREEVGAGNSEWGEESEVTAAVCLLCIIISLLSSFTCIYSYKVCNRMGRTRRVDSVGSRSVEYHEEWFV